MRCCARLRAVSVLYLGLAAGACNTLTGVDGLTVDDDLRADASIASPADETDAAPPRQDGAASDGPLSKEPDATTISTPHEAGADAPPLAFCSSLSPAPTLCTDFDAPGAPAPWQVSATGAATASVITSTARSRPSSLLLAHPGGTSGTAWLTHDFGTVAQSEIVVSFAARVDQARPGENELAVIYLGSSGGHRYEAQLELIDGQLNLEEERPQSDGGVPQTDTPLGITLPVAQWTRITMTVALAETSSSITFDVEGSAPVVLAVSAHLYKAAPKIQIGHEAATTTPFALGYDDVYVRVK